MRPLLVLLLLAPAAAAQEPGGAMVHAVDYRFLPSENNSTTGQVTLMSFGPSAHTFTADDGAFDVDLPAPPPSEWTERSLVVPPGEHPYHCKLHPNMTGLLRVTGTGAATTTTTTTTPPTATPTPIVRDPGFEAVLALAALAACAALVRRA